MSCGAGVGGVGGVAVTAGVEDDGACAGGVCVGSWCVASAMASLAGGGVPGVPPGHIAS